MEYFELINKYLDKELNESEIKNFKKSLSENRKLKQEFDLVVDVNEYLKDTDETEFRDELKQIIQKISKSRVNLLRKIIISPVSGIAASIILILAFSIYFYYNFSANKNDRIFAKYYQPYQYTNIERASNELDIHQSFQIALNEYNSKNYAKAIKLFEIVIEKDTKYIIASLLMAISYIENENFEKAIIILKEIISKDNYLINETANWYLALCYLKNNDLENASAIFRDLSTYNNFYNENAKKILYFF